MMAGQFLDPRTWQWDTLAILGFCGQALFASRFIFQWIASERRKRSHIPVQFWWLSLCGGVIVTIYGLLRRDPVIIFGQAPGLIVYARNLVLIHRHAEQHPTEDTAPDRA
ncbi:MAG TPA: lipid-A-disaccharide synthase N-terminal domain-containing protein [Thermoanaerobaculia bacterium]|jgi:lipid-A-disaccharide synthase-like uncharacterized protein